MTRRERGWCLVYAGILAVLTSIPYWIGYVSEGASWRFTGFVLGVEDGNSYIAKMLLGQGGAWLFRTPYTAMEQRGVVAFLPFLLLGKLASPPALHLQLTVLYHLFRIAMIPVVVMSMYRFAAVILQEPNQRRWATLLATAGGGLGWVLALTGSGSLAGSLPLDYISPESFGFLALYALPHLALTRALLLTALRVYLESDGQAAAGWKAGAILAGSTLVQPLPTLTGLAVIGAHQLLLALQRGRRFWTNWKDRWLPVLWRLLLPALPLLLYYTVMFSLDPYLRVWSAQNQLPSPPPIHYLLAFGLLLPFSLLGMAEGWRTRQVPAALLSAWVFIFPILAYIPYPVQRRLPEGVWVAISIMAVLGISRLSAGRRSLAWLQPGVAAFAMITSLSVIAGGAAVASDPARPAFVTVEDEHAYTWLHNHARPGDLVLASYGTGNALPAWAAVRVLIGLGPESAGLAELEPQVQAFYAGDWSESEQLAFLDEHGIRWIIAGPREDATWSLVKLMTDRMTLAYDRGGYRIFHIEEGS